MKRASGGTFAMQMIDETMKTTVPIVKTGAMRFERCFRRVFIITLPSIASLGLFGRGLQLQILDPPFDLFISDVPI